jgi:predicted CXXCH cytochrome family protein
MKRRLGIGSLATLLLGAAVAQVVQTSRFVAIRNSKHDFSAASAAPIRASSETAVCVFCHTPHRASPAVPLWNKSLGQGTTYQVYSSSTMTAPVSEPGLPDSSKLCLSCHDGTVALGDTVNNGQIPLQNVPADQRLPATSPSNIAGAGLTLADDHPIAFTPNQANQQIKVPPPGDPVKLDGQNKVQCSSCHDPHNEVGDPVEKRFLVKNNLNAAICTTCHELNGGTGSNTWSWSGALGPAAIHATAGNTYNATTNGGVASLGSHTGYTTVASNGCASCHRSHTAVQAPRLLKGDTDQVCFQCHDGNPATAIANVKGEFSKRYIHPATGPQPGHDPAEAPDNIVNRHVACDDCHNPHAVQRGAGVLLPPQLSFSLLGQSGVTAAGAPHDPRRGSGDAQFEYEICLKCHSYNPNQPQVPGYQAYGPMPRRQLPSTNLAAAFSSTASFHPVTQPRGLPTGPGTNVPSLLPNVVDGSGAPIPGRTLTASSQIYCTDCHNSDTGRNLGGTNNGPAGPHGSAYNHILERNYLIETPAGTPGNTGGVHYSSANYALCFKCHSEQSINNNQSFREHSEHTEFASCATCHDPHGVANGNPTNNKALINFDLNIVAPNGSGLLQYTSTGVGHGSCSLRCHGEDHNNESY